MARCQYPLGGARTPLTRTAGTQSQRRPVRTHALAATRTGGPALTDGHPRTKAGGAHPHTRYVSSQPVRAAGRLSGSALPECSLFRPGWVNTFVAPIQRIL